MFCILKQFVLMRKANNPHKVICIRMSYSRSHTKDHNRSNQTFATASEKLLELELLLGLGSQLSRHQLDSLLTKCEQIVKDQINNAKHN
jgi:hypothetical protein